MSPAADPWSDGGMGVDYVAFYSTTTGTASGNFDADTGATTSDLLGRAFVVHDANGGRIACALMEPVVDPLCVTNFATYPGYYGAFPDATGVITMATVDKTTQYFDYTLKGLDLGTPRAARDHARDRARDRDCDRVQPILRPRHAQAALAGTTPRSATRVAFTSTRAPRARPPARLAVTTPRTASPTRGRRRASPTSPPPTATRRGSFPPSLAAPRSMCSARPLSCTGMTAAASRAARSSTATPAGRHRRRQTCACRGARTTPTSTAPKPSFAAAATSATTRDALSSSPQPRSRGLRRSRSRLLASQFCAFTFSIFAFFCAVARATIPGVQRLWWPPWPWTKYSVGACRWWTPPPGR